jgi:phosphoglucomutase
MTSPMEQIRKTVDQKVKQEAESTGKKIEEVDPSQHYSASLKEVVDKYIQQANDNGVEMDAVWLTDRLNKLCGEQLTESEKAVLLSDWLKKDRL